MRACLEPPSSIVEVYGLQQSSSDWTPEWQLERTRLLKDGAGVGDRFYLERASSQQVLRCHRTEGSCKPMAADIARIYFSIIRVLMGSMNHEL